MNQFEQGMMFLLHPLENSVLNDGVPDPEGILLRKQSEADHLVRELATRKGVSINEFGCLYNVFVGDIQGLYVEREERIRHAMRANITAGNVHAREPMPY